MLDFFRDPDVIRTWKPRQWNTYQSLARRFRLLGRSYFALQDHGLIAQAPERLVDQYRGALAQTRYVQSRSLREFHEVKRVLDREGVPVIALKGLAYLLTDAPLKQWRSLSDIDLLVPRQAVELAERALAQRGWGPSGEFSDYDQRYYRAWMHELPPMVHAERSTEVDLHHNLAPPVSRIVIDAELLWDKAVSVMMPGNEQALVLAPADMLLHNAVHLFMNDELRGGLRDVVDFRDLFLHFAARDDGFETDLLARATQLGCGRPLYYAVTVAERLIGLGCSDRLRYGVQQWCPAKPVAALMAGLIDEALAPPALGRWQTATAQQLLFVRSHWIRMPPLMLTQHLLRKALRAKRSMPSGEPDLPG